VELNVGRNRVELVAEAVDGCETRHEFFVDGGDPGVRAVIVGIAAYEQVERLEYADEDAMEFAAHLEAQFTDPPARIELLTDGAATRENILKTVMTEGRWVSKQGTFIVYFSGHGGLYQSARNELQAYLVPVKGTSDVAATGILRETLFDALDEAAGTKIFVLDSCFSGLLPGEPPPVSTIGRAKALTGSIEFRQDYRLPALYRARDGVLGFTSSSATDISYELTDKKHGLFTYYLLESATQATPNDPVLYMEAAKYTREQIKNVHDGLQTPEMWLNPASLGELVWASKKP
jgi:hypothetical protein